MSLNKSLRTRLSAGIVLAVLASSAGLLAGSGHRNRRRAEGTATSTTVPTVGEDRDGGILLPTNQRISPIGTVRLLEGTRPKDLALSPDGRTAAVLTMRGVELFGVDGEPAGRVPLSAGVLGVAWAPGGDTLYASLSSGRIARVTEESGAWKADGEFPAEDRTAGPSVPTFGGEGTLKPRSQKSGQPNGLAVSRDGKRLFVALGVRNSVSVLNLPEMTVAASIPVGVAPYSVALSPDGRTLVVANRGGESPSQAHPVQTAVSGGSPVRIDANTDAALRGSLSLIDTDHLTSREIPAGRQPGGMAITRDGATLYVANSDEDTVSEVDLEEGKVRRSFSVRPEEDPGFGQIPTAVALSPDERTLYVALGGANAVAVVPLGERPRVEGYLPTGWYPIALAALEGRLIVANSKGIGARQPDKNGNYRVHGSVGSIQFVAAGAWSDLKAQSLKVAENNLWEPGGHDGQEEHARKKREPRPIPERRGEPSVFQHVVYILKENHTYDTDLGDMPEGRGEKKLCLFGEGVTPNEHALARQFVLLDNTYTSGTNSADGHQWTDSAVANGYIEQNFGSSIRSYPYDGGDPLSASPQGFLWNAVARQKLQQRIYGEFVNRPRVEAPPGGEKPSWLSLWQDYTSGKNSYRMTANTDTAALKPFLHPNYIGWPIIVSDQWRADQFLADLTQWEHLGKMPSFCMLLLPMNHTEGTTPHFPTPRAAVADNDLALGRIVERLSHSYFWKKTLILVIEDDSQLGLDHVDGHRTLAFCISPYTKRGAVVHEPYNHTSFIRTIGLVLGLPPMTRFDRTATPLTACFQDEPDFTPYMHLPNTIPLDELNPSAASLKGEAKKLAQASAKQDWSDLDRADPGVVARAVWRAQRGKEPFPKYAFHPPGERDGD